MGGGQRCSRLSHHSVTDLRSQVGVWQHDAASSYQRVRDSVAQQLRGARAAALLQVRDGREPGRAVGAPPLVRARHVVAAPPPPPHSLAVSARASQAVPTSTDSPDHPPLRVGVRNVFVQRKVHSAERNAIGVQRNGKELYFVYHVLFIAVVCEMSAEGGGRANVRPLDVADLSMPIARTQGAGLNTSLSRGAPKLRRNRPLQQCIRDYAVYEQRLQGVPLPASSAAGRSPVEEGYALQLHRVRVRLPVGTAARAGGLAARYSVCLYDPSSASFFGRTHVSGRLLPLADVGGGIVEIGADLVYCLSTLRDAGVVAVVEPCLCVLNPASGQVTSCSSLGWAPLAMFAPGRALVDVADGRGGGAGSTRLETSLYDGSPRALPLSHRGIAFPVVPGGCVTYTLRTHRKLRLMRHLVFDSELFGPFDIIPGLTLVRLGGAWAPCLSPPPGEAFHVPQEPRLAPRLRLTCTSTRLLLPPAFDARLCALLVSSAEAEAVLVGGGQPRHLVPPPRIIGRTLTLALANGHTTLSRASVDLGEGGGEDEDGEAEELAALDGSRLGPAPERPPAIGTPGTLAPAGCTLLSSPLHAEAVLHGYTPHERCVLIATLSYALADGRILPVGSQTFIPADAPDDGGEGGGAAGRPHRNVFFATRGGSDDPSCSHSYTRRPLEMPLAAPLASAGLGGAQSVALDPRRGVPPAGALRFNFGSPLGPVLGMRLRLGVEEGGHRVSVVSAVGCGGEVHEAGPAARAPPVLTRSPVLALSSLAASATPAAAARSATQHVLAPPAAARPVPSTSTPAPVPAPAPAVEAKAAAPEKSSRSKGKGRRHMPRTPSPSSSEGSATDSGRSAGAAVDRKVAGGPPVRVAGGYESPTSVGSDDEEGVHGPPLSGTMRSLLADSGVGAGSGEGLLASLLRLPLAPAPGEGPHLFDTLMRLPLGGTHGSAPRTAVVPAPRGGSAGAAPPRPPASIWGAPLPPSERGRLLALSGLSAQPSDGGGLPPVGRLLPPAAVALEVSDPLAATTLSLTFGAWTGTGGLAALAEVGGLETTILSNRGGGAGAEAAPPQADGQAAPRAVYFTFHVGSTAVRTPPATLVPLEAGPHGGGQTFALEGPGGGPLTVRVRVDAGRAGPSGRRQWATHAVTNPLCIEVWDADSLLPLGLVTVGGALLLRGQARACAVAREWEVLSAPGGVDWALGGYALDGRGEVAQTGSLTGRLSLVVSAVGGPGSGAVEGSDGEVRLLGAGAGGRGGRADRTRVTATRGSVTEATLASSSGGTPLAPAPRISVATSRPGATAHVYAAVGAPAEVRVDFTNPYEHPASFGLHGVGARSVRLGDVEGAMWGGAEGDGDVTLTLGRGEGVSLPLRVLSFAEPHPAGVESAFTLLERIGAQVVPLAPPAQLLLGDAHPSADGSLEAHTVTVTSPGPSGTLVATLTLVLHPFPPLIARTLRYSVGENATLRTTLLLPASSPFAVVPSADGGSGGIVASVMQPSDAAAAAELRLQVRTGHAQSSSTFTVYLYADESCASLATAWRVVVTSVLAFAIAPALATGAGVDLLVRGGALPRQVALFASDPREVAFVDGTAVGGAGVGCRTPTFTLQPHALNRIELLVRPLRPGPRTHALHLVAMDGQSAPCLLAAWAVSGGGGHAAITRVYDVTLPYASSLGGGPPTPKRVPYSNEWSHARTVRVLSSSPSLVRVREGLVHLGPREKGAIRLTLAPGPGPMTEEVLLFVLDEAGAAEETLLLRLSWPAAPAE